VRSGDTLGAIAERVDVPVDRLLVLNPDVDPQSLRAGQRLRLRE
jgi:LysM repeat protein